MVTGTERRVEDVAQELFALVTKTSISTLRDRRRKGDLKEIEYLTLSLLQANGTMIVGDIQRVLGILPAQMSRIIRALENHQPPLIHCQINSSDKRKIDVVLSPEGERLLFDYQSSRINNLADRLRELSEEEREEILPVIHRLSALLDG